jgi:hypothetical protein
VPVVVVVVAGWWLGHVNWFAVQVQPVVIGAQLSAVIWRCVVPVRSHSPGQCVSVRQSQCAGQKAVVVPVVVVVMQVGATKVPSE